MAGKYPIEDKDFKVHSTGGRPRGDASGSLIKGLLVLGGVIAAVWILVSLVSGSGATEEAAEGATLRNQQLLEAVEAADEASMR